MTQHEEELEQILRPWMHRHAPDAPNTFVLRMIGEIETMSERAPTRGFLSRFAAWPAAAWAATLAAVAIIVAAGGILFANLTGAPAVGNGASPTPLPDPRPTDATAIVDGLLSAWNSGDPQDAIGRYIPLTPNVRFITDSGDVTTRLSNEPKIQAAVVAWSGEGSVMTRTGPVVRQGALVAFPMTWTSPNSSGNGVQVLRLDPGSGLVLVQYVIGATSSNLASSGRASADIVSMLDAELAAENAADGPAGSALVAADAEYRWLLRGDLRGAAAIGRSAVEVWIASGLGSVTGIRTNTPATQGPFVFYAGKVTAADGSDRGDGINVYELDANGLIRYGWNIGYATPEPQATAVPTASGG